MQKNGYVYSIADEYREHGVSLIPSLKQKEDSAIGRVNEFFKAGKIKIFKNCVNLIRELQDYRWKDATDLSVNASEEPVKRNDHAADALRYFVMTREKASEIPEKKPVYEHKKEKSLYEADSKLQEVFEDES
jgi:phage terminase large subunit